MARRVQRPRLDLAKWKYDTALNKKGWFNHEKQYYSAGRPENLRVANGMLTIAARHEAPRSAPDWGGQNYTSAKIVSNSAWTYGFYEIRAKLPCARGTWPAIWMLRQERKKWPDEGEIDIMEQVGAEPNLIYSTLHTKAYNHTIRTQKSAQRLVADQLHRLPSLPARLAAQFDHHRGRRSRHLAQSSGSRATARTNGRSTRRSTSSSTSPSAATGRVRRG